MKKLCILLVLIGLLLCACSSQHLEVFTVERYDKVFTIDTDACTITADDQVYSYSISGKTINITYPNGATYWWNVTDHGGNGGWEGDYDTTAYIDGLILADILEDQIQTERSYKNIVLILLLMALGGWYAVSPRSAWYISYGWIYKNAEPSEMALVISRICGIVIVLFAVFMLFI